MTDDRYYQRTAHSASHCSTTPVQYSAATLTSQLTHNRSLQRDGAFQQSSVAITNMRSYNCQQARTDHALDVACTDHVSNAVAEFSAVARYVLTVSNSGLLYRDDHVTDFPFHFHFSVSRLHPYHPITWNFDTCC